jgi:O-acetylhomoserine/O-acetylserine sulfhydrylase-like pyridoxal-dependent enzyme
MERGKAAFAFASGLAATRAVTTLLQSGDHVVVTDNTYGGTYRLFERVLRKGGLDFTYVDTSDLDATAAAFKPNTKMLFVETPTNPVLRITDLAAVSTLAHDRDAFVVVDNTFASPYAQRPIEFGADLVLHSTTKFLNGHSDSVGGIVVGVRDEHIAWLKFVQNAEGAILGPMDSWLVLRGTKTLPVRLDQVDRQDLLVEGLGPAGAGLLQEDLRHLVGGHLGDRVGRMDEDHHRHLGGPGDRDPQDERDGGEQEEQAGPARAGPLEPPRVGTQGVQHHLPHSLL